MAETTSMKPVLVGEANPYGGDPDFALYPAPEGCSGHRLCCDILGMRRVDYLREFERVNLCPQEWDTAVARETVRNLLQRVGYCRFVLLGSKVCDAFAVRYEPTHRPRFSARHQAVVLPHPSGRCRYWSGGRAAVLGVRSAVAEFLPDLAYLLGVTDE